MFNIEVGNLYAVKGNRNWKSYDKYLYIVSSMHHSVIDMDKDLHKEIMDFFSETYNLDESKFNSLVADVDGKILKCYDMTDLSDIPEVYDDPDRIVHIPQCIIGNSTDNIIVGENVEYLIQGTTLHKGTLHPMRVIQDVRNISSVIQNIVPGASVKQSARYTMLMGESEINESAKEAEAKRDEILTKSKLLENENNVLLKEISSRSLALDKEQAMVNARMSYATSKVNDAVLLMNSMTQFLNILAPNYEYNDLISGVDYIELRETLESIKNGSFFNN